MLFTFAAVSFGCFPCSPFLLPFPPHSAAQSARSHAQPWLLLGFCHAFINYWEYFIAFSLNFEAVAIDSAGAQFKT